jgi:adenosylmethionine-8-amino-7-oxononanoate aminotransferase
MSRSALWRPYTQMQTAPEPLRALSTSGVRIVLEDGRVLIDGIASWWTACHGYNHPKIRAAVEDQLRRMPHVMFGGLTHGPAERLAERLAGLLPGTLDHVFFSDSGSVAVEVAMKMALQYWLNRGEIGRTRFLAFRGGYHGDTLGAMSVCDPFEGMHARFGAALPRQVFADLPRTDAETAALEAVFEAEGASLAGVVIEPLVQGAGGMRLHDPATLGRVLALARKCGLLVIADEIFTGFGRTGRMFASDAASDLPDIVCLSKALTGGTMGLAATVASKRVFEAFLAEDPGAALMHGPTFMANPLACAAANASLDLFEEEPRLEEARAMEGRLLEGLGGCRGLPGVLDVRALGALGAVQLAGPIDREAMKAAFIEKGVWIRPFGDVVYLAPALNIAAADLERLADAVFSVLKAGAWRPSQEPRPVQEF